MSQIKVVFNNLPDLAAALGTNGDAIVAATAEAIAGQAKGAVPVDTGELQGSITVAQAGNCHYTVTAGTDHAKYVEYGTARHGGPRPFMVPAAHAAEPAYVAAMGAILGAAG